MNKLRKLTQAEKDKLKAHSAHHSKRHLASMRMNMMRGKSFAEAHHLAQKKIGK